MATLEKIRSKGPFLVIVIGIALLAFIIGDLLNSGATYFGQSKETIAKIGDEKIHYTEFYAAVDQLTEVYKIETGQTDLSEDMINQIRNSVWENLINEKIISKEAKKVGLTVSPDELADRCFGSNIHPIIQQRGAFVDETGRFSRTVLIRFLNSLDQPPMNEEMRAQIAQAKSYWKYWENAVRLSILQEKYNALLGKSIVANNIDAKYHFDANKVVSDVNYVSQSYFLIPDSTVTVTDNEIKNYYNKNKEEYKIDESRNLLYVVFDVKPSQDDFKEAEDWINNLAEEFRTTNDVAGLVNTNSDIIYNGFNYSESNVPANLKDFAFGGTVGDVTDPVFQNETYTMARIMQTGILRADSVKLRHIYLVEDNVSKADSIENAIRKGGDFAALARQYSAVQQTANNGGEIGWFTDGMQGVDKEVSEPAFVKAVNEVFTVKNDQGVQIFQIMEKTPVRKKVKLAILERKVIPSSRTTANIFNEAKQFAVEAKDINAFENAAKENNYIVRNANDVLKSTNNIGTVSQSRQIVRWAFENKKGKISDVFDCNTQFVVSAITDENKDGYRSLASVSPQIRVTLAKEKKGDLLVKQLSEKVSGGDLNTLAETLHTSVNEALAVNFDAYQFGAAGSEPAVIGKVSVSQPNVLSAPIKGNTGVYVIQVVAQNQNDASFDANFEKQKIESRSAYSFPYMLQQDLRNNIKIEDYRLNFY